MMSRERDIFSSFRPGQMVSAERVARTLDALGEIAGDAGHSETLYLPASGADDSPAWTKLAREPGGPAWIGGLDRACGRAIRSHSGIAAFRAGDAGVAFLTPFPLHASSREDGIRDEPLRDLLASQFTVGVALVRLGRYAIAVYEGQRLAVSKTDTRYVKSKHHAGGTSQRRFSRVRENQIHRLYAEASRILEQQWGPWLGRLDYVALGGEAATVNGFVRECDTLGRLSSITLPRRLDVREPNRAALDSLGPTLYQCRVYPLRWDD